MFLVPLLDQAASDGIHCQSSTILMSVGRWRFFPPHSKTRSKTHPTLEVRWRRTQHLNNFAKISAKSSVLMIYIHSQTFAIRLILKTGDGCDRFSQLFCFCVFWNLGIYNLYWLSCHARLGTNAKAKTSTIMNSPSSGCIERKNGGNNKSSSPLKWMEFHTAKLRTSNWNRGVIMNYQPKLHMHYFCWVFFGSNFTGLPYICTCCKMLILTKR